MKLPAIPKEANPARTLAQTLKDTRANHPHAEELREVNLALLCIANANLLSVKEVTKHLRTVTDYAHAHPADAHEGVASFVQNHAPALQEQLAAAHGDKPGKPARR